MYDDRLVELRTLAQTTMSTALPRVRSTDVPPLAPTVGPVDCSPAACAMTAASADRFPRPPVADGAPFGSETEMLLARAPPSTRASLRAATVPMTPFSFSRRTGVSSARPPEDVTGVIGPGTPSTAITKLHRWWDRSNSTSIRQYCTNISLFKEIFPPTQGKGDQISVHLLPWE